MTASATPTTNALAGYVNGRDHSGDEGLTQRAYHALRQAIRDLKLQPGQPIIELEVAAALGMSRTPVREALARLQADSLVQGAARGGLEVTRLAPDDLQEIYEIVEGLEGMAVALAAERAQPECLDALDQLIAGQDAALASDDLMEWVDLDERFHGQIVECSGNQRLRRLLETYNDQLYRARLFTIRLRPKPARSNAEHRAVAAAIRAGDPSGARSIHQAHRHRARDEILTIIRALVPPGT